MDITISISDKTVEIIQSKADGKAVNDFLKEFVEKSFANGNGGEPVRKRKLSEFAGMFRSGHRDTSERMSEIMRETDFDPAEGFSSGIPKK